MHGYMTSAEIFLFSSNFRLKFNELGKVIFDACC